MKAQYPTHVMRRAYQREVRRRLTDPAERERFMEDPKAGRLPHYLELALCDLALPRIDKEAAVEPLKYAMFQLWITSLVHASLLRRARALIQTVEQALGEGKKQNAERSTVH